MFIFFSSIYRNDTLTFLNYPDVDNYKSLLAFDILIFIAFEKTKFRIEEMFCF